MGTRFSLIGLLILASAQLAQAAGAHLAVITWDKFGTFTSTIANTRQTPFALKDLF